MHVAMFMSMISRIVIAENSAIYVVPTIVMLSIILFLVKKISAAGTKGHYIKKNNPGLQSLKMFKVQEMGWNPSNHTPISIECKLSFENHWLCRLASADILTNQSKKMVKKPMKIIS